GRSAPAFFLAADKNRKRRQRAMSQGVNSSEVAQMEAPSAPTANPEHGLPENFGEGLLGKLLFWTAVSFSTFQVVTAFGIPLDRPFAGISMIHVIGAAFVVWAVWLVAQRARGRSILNGALALLTLAITYGLILKFPG